MMNLNAKLDFQLWLSEERSKFSSQKAIIKWTVMDKTRHFSLWISIKGIQQFERHLWFVNCDLQVRTVDIRHVMAWSVFHYSLSPWLEQRFWQLLCHRWKGSLNLEAIPSPPLTGILGASEWGRVGKQLSCASLRLQSRLRPTCSWLRTCTRSWRSPLSLHSFCWSPLQRAQMT